MNNFLSENVTLNNIENIFENKKNKTSNNYIVKYIHNGTPIIYTYQNGKLNISKASIEHTEIRNLNINSPLKHIEYLYGIGNSLYLLFVRYMIFINFLYSIITFGNIIPSIIYTKQSESYNFFGILNIEYYDEKVKPFWMATVIVINICSFICGFIFYLISKTYVKKKQQNNDNENIIIQYDTIQNNKYISKKIYIIRIILSYFVYMIILCLGGIIAYYVTIGGNYIQQYEFEKGFIIPVMVSLVNIGVRIISKIICKVLTNFERHSKWSQYRQHWLIKFFSFKFFNVIILYYAQYLAHINKTGKCPLSDIGSQYVANYVLDIVMSSLFGSILPLFNFYCIKHKGENIKRKNDEAKDSFDIVEEYLEIFYQQFSLYLCGTIVPSIYFIGFIGSIITYYFDKLRMTKLCYVKISHKSPNILLLLMTTLISVIAFFVFPDGVYWILSNTPKSRFEPCSFLK